MLNAQSAHIRSFHGLSDAEDIDVCTWTLHGAALDKVAAAADHCMSRVGNSKRILIRGGRLSPKGANIASADCAESCIPCLGIALHIAVMC